MAATLVQTLAAVRAALAPLVANGVIKAVLNGPADDLNQFPSVDVLWGAGTVGRDPSAGVLERQQVRSGIARVYVNRGGVLRTEYPKVAPLIDAVEAAFGAAPTLNGVVDRFDATGNGVLSQDDALKALYVDVGWQAMSIEPDTFIQDW
jgi:hypothetical protein